MKTVGNSLTWSSSEDSFHMISNPHAIAVTHRALAIYRGYRHGSAVLVQFLNSKVVTDRL